MIRKRSISSILDETRKNRYPTSSFQAKPRKRKKVSCYCDKCNGKLVLEQTKFIYESTGNVNDPNKDEISEDEDTLIIINPNIIEEVEHQIEGVDIESSISALALNNYVDNQSQQAIDEINPEFSFMPRKCVRHTSRSNISNVPSTNLN